MKIRVLSDLHTEGYKYTYEPAGEDVLVLAGDIGVGEQCIDFINNELPDDLPIIFIPGNHEYYGQCFEDMNRNFELVFKGTNVHFLRNDSCVIDGVRFLGTTLHSDFGLFGEDKRWFVERASARGINDFHVIRHEDSSIWNIEDNKREFETAYDFLKGVLNIPFNGKTVVVTHFCPSIHSVSERYKDSIITPFFASDCELLMGFSGVWIHGHTHSSFDYMIGNTRVVCNPRGYGLENKGGFVDPLIIEV